MPSSSQRQHLHGMEAQLELMVEQGMSAAVDAAVRLSLVRAALRGDIPYETCWLKLTDPVVDSDFDKGIEL